jgi:hypothetical protein
MNVFERRDFLKHAGAGLAVTAPGLQPQRSSAQSASAGVPVFSPQRVSNRNLYFCNAAPDTHSNQADRQSIG